MSIIKTAWKKWLAIAHVIGNFQGQVILTVFYFLLVWPIGIVYRFFTDPLKMKKAGSGSNFQKWEHKKDTIGSATRQF
ncbi:hypothetical protein HY024_03430 [Candidatus Curtissbacteria bacterium]|nr:hypothetical protein [Candidatus Curtissbacteria bacterium]